MQHHAFGVQTLLTRVERWQCDFNDHWNARFYARSFQMAAETVACIDASPNPGAATTRERHMRFHRELVVGEVVEVRSARLSGGPHDGRIAHCLLGGGRLSAFAIDLPGLGAGGLPEVGADAVARLLPRDAGPVSAPLRPGPDDGTMRFEVGPARPADLDHTGALLFEELVARTAVCTHSLLASLGFTIAFTNETGVGRMAVELAVHRSGAIAAGTPAAVWSRLASVAERSFTIEHRLASRDGETVAALRQTLIPVDLRTRKAVATPAFLPRLPPRPPGTP